VYSRALSLVSERGIHFAPCPPEPKVWGDLALNGRRGFEPAFSGVRHELVRHALPAVIDEGLRMGIPVGGR